MSGLSSLDTYLVKIWYIAKAIAQPKATSDKGSKTLEPGLKIIKIPINPIKIAVHLLHPTFSFKKKTDKAATIKGQLAKIA